MIYTSYFANMRKMTDEQKARCISIARFTPPKVNIPICKTLAPQPELLNRYKETKDAETFATLYQMQLMSLDNITDLVENELEGKILLCFEKSSDFCHRHVLAEYLREHGCECEELAL